MTRWSGSNVGRQVDVTDDWGQSSDPAHAGAVLVRRADETVHSVLARRSDSFPEETTRGTNVETTAVRPAFAGRGQLGDNLARRIDFPPSAAPRMPPTTFHALQEWEGYVVDIGETDFVARVVDLTAGSEQADEEATIPLSEISDRDAERIREGSIFRWVIGYERSVTGTKKRVSQIVFRDLPAITSTDLRDADVWAADTARAFQP